MNMKHVEYKNLSSPDETRTFPHGKLELINIGTGTVGRLTLEPGWRWSKHVKPIAGTEWCEAPHFQYQASGRLHVVMEDGTEFDLGPGDVRSCQNGMMLGSSVTSLLSSLTGTERVITQRVNSFMSGGIERRTNRSNVHKWPAHSMADFSCSATGG